jgi:hypothetical protein
MGRTDRRNESLNICTKQAGTKEWKRVQQCKDRKAKGIKENICATINGS